MTTYSKVLAHAAIGLGLTLAAACNASAATIGFSGDTTGAPTYNRPLSVLGALSSVGTAVHYQVHGFTVSANGTYSIATTSANWQNSDTFLTLYSGTFDPLHALTNAIVADDDNGPGALSLFSRALTTSTQYFLVVTGFENSMFGAYTGTIGTEGNGIATINQANVPLPSSFALLGLGVLALFARRSRPS